MAAQSAVIDLYDQQNNGELPPEQKIHVLAALSDILQSTPFKTSKQSQQLLQYIVQKTVEGHFELLKERIIGAQVFGRRADYDTNDDPVVRTRAGEVRKRLAQYYLGEGNQNTLRIEISPGSYHATFSESLKPSPVVPLSDAHPNRVIAHVEVPTQENVADEAKSRVIAKRLPRLTKAWGIGLLTLLAVSVAAFYVLWPPEPIDVFWQPLMQATKPVLIYSGANAVYMLSDEFMNKYKSSHRIGALDSKGHEFVIPLSADTRISATDLVAFKDEFVTIGDLAANVRVTALLARHKKSFDLRSGEDVAFSDLEESPSLLVGAFNNKWTMELTGNLPFTFDSGLTIRDVNNQGRSWTPTLSPDGAVTLDYAIVTRVPRAKSGQPLITIAGITQFGTRAAADFITTPELLNEFLKSAPKDWASKSMQIILQTRVMNNIPTAPEVVATRYW